MIRITVRGEMVHVENVKTADGKLVRIQLDEFKAPEQSFVLHPGDVFQISAHVSFVVYEDKCPR